MKRLSLLATAALLSSLSGCCCGWPCGPCGGGGGGGCGPGGCQYGAPAGAPAYAPQGMYQTYDSVTGLPVPTTTAYAPTAPAVSLGPMEALPTYR